MRRRAGVAEDVLWDPRMWSSLGALGSPQRVGTATSHVCSLGKAWDLCGCHSVCVLLLETEELKYFICLSRQERTSIIYILKMNKLRPEWLNDGWG